MQFELVVSFEAPHKLLASEASQQSCLGYDTVGLRGQTFDIFKGPRTDAIRLSNAIKQTSFCVSTSLQSILYDRLGRWNTFLVTCSPFLDDTGLPSACKISFESSAAITMDESLQISSWPRILVTIDNDNLTIVLACSKFTEAFGFAPDCLLGLSISSLAPKSDSLRNLVNFAGHGRVQRATLPVRTAFKDEYLCAITCVPVSPSVGSQISHVLILIEPHHRSTDDPEPRTRPIITRAGPAVIAPIADAVALGDNETPPPAAAAPLSLQTLRALGDVPLYRAAQLLNISPSSLKAACRRLGLARWPRAGWSAAESRPGGASHNIAYARQLFRKYSRTPGRVSGRPRIGTAGQNEPETMASSPSWPDPRSERLENHGVWAGDDVRIERSESLARSYSAPAGPASGGGMGLITGEDDMEGGAAWWLAGCGDGGQRKHRRLSAAFALDLDSEEGGSAANSSPKYLELTSGE
jgi:hypothetical protein